MLIGYNRNGSRAQCRMRELYFVRIFGQLGMESSHICTCGDCQGMLGINLCIQHCGGELFELLICKDRAHQCLDARGLTSSHLSDCFFHSQAALVKEVLRLLRKLSILGLQRFGGCIVDHRFVDGTRRCVNARFVVIDDQVDVVIVGKDQFFCARTCRQTAHLM